MLTLLLRGLVARWLCPALSLAGQSRTVRRRRNRPLALPVARGHGEPSDLRAVPAERPGLKSVATSVPRSRSRHASALGSGELQGADTEPPKPLTGWRWRSSCGDLIATPRGASREPELSRGFPRPSPAAGGIIELRPLRSYRRRPAGGSLDLQPIGFETPQENESVGELSVFVIRSSLRDVVERPTGRIVP